MSLHEPETNSERFCQAILAPLSGIWAVAVKLRQYLYEHNILKSKRLPAPVISLGNLTTGGTGKTPLVIDLASFFSTRGIKVGILSRGYRRQSRQPYVVVSDGKEMLSSATQAGDEPYLIAQACPQAVVIVGSNRAKTGALAQSHYGCQLLILDDGFQHRRLQRDLDIVLYDYNDDPDKLQFLPAGKLREPLSALTRASMVIITKIPAERSKTQIDRVDKITRQIQAASPELPIIQSSFTANTLYRYTGLCRQEIPLSRIQVPVFVLTGIARPKQFISQIQDCGAIITGSKIFADHHWFSKEDLHQIKEKFRESGAQFIITTEKDAVRLPAEFCQSLPLLTFSISVQWHSAAPYVRILETLDKKYGTVFASVLPETGLDT